MVIDRAIKQIQEFILLESSSGIILCLMAVLAIIVDNSPIQEFYNALLTTSFSIQLGTLSLAKPLLKWVNDGLMTIFFLLVGLEIKREILEGELNSTAKLALPGIAAIGGMLIPALIFISINIHNPTNLDGWAIPTATDIAFALGALMLLGKRVPVSLKVFLTALAILDDLGAIIIIAIFYTHELAYLSLVLSGLCVLLLIILNRWGVKAFTPYVLVGIVLWVCVLKSGVHATLAGVVLAMAIPLRGKDDHDHSPLREMEHALHPWVAFGVLPVFAFFNAGISFAGITWRTFVNPLTLGIAAALFLGKQIGVFGFSWLGVKLGIAKLPEDMDWRWLYGVSLICGIGFTMSLFIGTLAFNESGNTGNFGALIRLGVIVGSLLSGILGYLTLFSYSNHKRR